MDECAPDVVGSVGGKGDEGFGEVDCQFGFVTCCGARTIAADGEAPEGWGEGFPFHGDGVAQFAGEEESVEVPEVGGEEGADVGGVAEMVGAVDSLFGQELLGCRPSFEGPYEQGVGLVDGDGKTGRYP